MVLNDERNQIVSSVNYSLFIQILELNNYVYWIEEQVIVIYRNKIIQLKKIFYTILDQYGKAKTEVEI